MNAPYTEEQLKALTEAAVANFMPALKKTMEDAACEFEISVRDNAWQSYQYHKDKIDNTLIEEIVGRFKGDPTSFKFNGLREKLFEENKEKLIPILTQDAVSRALDIVLNRYTHLDHYFSWRWKDEILRYVLENWDKLKDDKRINDGILRDKQKDLDTIEYWKKEAAKFKALAGNVDYSD
jgi:hypothetical protein